MPGIVDANTAAPPADVWSRVGNEEGAGILSMLSAMAVLSVILGIVLAALTFSSSIVAAAVYFFGGIVAGVLFGVLQRGLWVLFAIRIHLGDLAAKP